MKTIAIFMAMVFGLILISGCATNNTRQGAMIGAGGGTIASILLDKNPTTSALLILGGALLGGVIGNEMDERERAKEASEWSRAYPNKKVLLIEQEPTKRTDCKKVTTIEWKNGQKIKETVKEVCTGTKTTNAY